MRHGRQSLDGSSEVRALGIAAANTGGYAVPQLFADQIEQAQKQYSAIWNTATILSTPESGATLPLPMLNLTADPGQITAEGTATALDSATPWATLQFTTYTYKSKMLPVSLEYLDDTAFGEPLIAQALGVSCARAAAPHFTTGTGTGQPTGLVTAATVGKVGLTGQTLTVIYDDLADLVASLDAAYCEPSEGAVIGWMLHPLSLAIIRKIKDSANNPLIPPETLVDSKGVTRPAILGYPVYVNQDMPTMAANAKSIAFGRLDKYAIRRGPIHLVRAAERYADQLQVGLQLVQRLDGNLLDAGTHPIRLYQNSAS